MGADVVIRCVEERDLEGLADLAQRTWRDAFGSSLDADDLATELETGRSVEYFAGALARSTILVAEDDVHLAGYVQFGPVDIPEVSAEAQDRQVHRLYVDGSLQRRGIGRRLMTAALGQPELANARHVYLAVWEENSRALQLYESLGFVRVGVTRFFIGDKQIGEDLVMCRERGHGQGGVAGAGAIL